MPKFRDLGINSIPLTMQPPAIGDGGGGGAECGTQCGPSTCSTASPKKQASSFNPEAVTQIRQQLESRLGV
jgi:hypothetical protein